MVCITSVWAKNIRNWNRKPFFPQQRQVTQKPASNLINNTNGRQEGPSCKTTPPGMQLRPDASAIGPVPAGQFPFRNRPEAFDVSCVTLRLHTAGFSKGLIWWFSKFTSVILLYSYAVFPFHQVISGQNSFPFPVGMLPW